MRYMCYILGINNKVIDKLVDIRNNNFDVAHADLREIEVNNQDLEDCKNLAKQVIENYTSKIKP